MLEALTQTIAGQRFIPSSDDEWDDWVSASATRNHVLDDPLLEDRKSTRLNSSHRL